MATPVVNNSSSNNSLWTQNIARLLSYATILFRMVLWPVRRMLDLMFPLGPFEGLNNASCARAVADFYQEYIQPHYTNTNTNAGGTANNGWITHQGFNQFMSSQLSTQPGLLLLYIHSPLHAHARDFVRHILLNEEFKTFLTHVNQSSFTTMLNVMGVSIHSAQGHSLSNLLQLQHAHPSLLLLRYESTVGSGNARNSRKTKVQSLVRWEYNPSNNNLNSIQHLLHVLRHAIQKHSRHVEEVQATRLQREQDALLLKDQDEQYKMALKADQERERQKQLQLEAEQKIKMEKIQKEQAELKWAQTTVQSEPSSGGIKLCFRLPNGKRLIRSFGPQDTLDTLFAYLFLHFHAKQGETDYIKNFSISTRIPKRTFLRENSDNKATTLPQAGIESQATLMVQDLDT